MKRLVCFLMVLGIVGGLAVSAGAEDDQLLAAISEQVRTGYLTDSGFMNQKRSVSQADLLVPVPLKSLSGIYVKSWISEGIVAHAAKNREIDAYLGWAGKFKFLPGELKSLNWDAGMGYYFLGELGKVPKDDLFVPFIDINRKFGPWENHSFWPYIRLESYFQAEGKESRNGIYLYAGLKHTWQISSRFCFKHGFNFLYDNGVGGADPGVIGKYVGGLNIALNQKGALTMDVGSVKVTFPVSGCNDRKPEATFGIGLNYSFYKKGG